MMSLCRRLPRLPLLLLALGLLAGPVSLASYAWCHDSGGQAEFKVAGDGNCCSSGGKTVPSTATNPATVLGDQCGCEDSRCLDISAHPHWRSHRIRSPLAKIFPPPAIQGPATVAVTPPAFNSTSGAINPDSSPRIPDAILLHRTVVLLI